VDVHYHTYPWGETYHAGGAHICVWATEGVTIHSNGDPIDGPTAATSQATGENGFSAAWTVSAELWQVDDITHIRRPWEGDLQVTPSLAHQDAAIAASVERFPDGAPAIHLVVG